MKRFLLILVQVSFRRHPTVYVVNLLVPTCFFVLVDLFSFVLPAKSAMRPYLKMTLILGYTLFLLNTNDLLPGSGDTLPLISPCTMPAVGALTCIQRGFLCSENRNFPPPRCFPGSVSRSDDGESTGNHSHHQPVQLGSPPPSPSLDPMAVSPHPGPPGGAASRTQRRDETS